jgi:hypothetical protein
MITTTRVAPIPNSSLSDVLAGTGYNEQTAKAAIANRIYKKPAPKEGETRVVNGVTETYHGGTWTHLPDAMNDLLNDKSGTYKPVTTVDTPYTPNLNPDGTVKTEQKPVSLFGNATSNPVVYPTTTGTTTGGSTTGTTTTPASSDQYNTLLKNAQENKYVNPYTWNEPAPSGTPARNVTYTPDYSEVNAAAGSDLFSGLSTPEERAAAIAARNAKSSTWLSSENPANKAYALQRTGIKQQSSATGKDTMSAIARNLSSRGFGAGSGFLESAQAQALGDIAVGEGQALSNIDVAQLQTEAQRQENERQRMFGAEENDINRVLQYDVLNGDLNKATANLAMTAATFKSQQDFNKWAVDAGFEENDINRAWEAKENATTRAFNKTEADTTRDYNAWAAKNLTISNADLANLNSGNRILENNASSAFVMETTQYYQEGALASKPPTAANIARYNSLTPVQKKAWDAGVIGVAYDKFVLDNTTDANAYTAQVTALYPSDPNFALHFNDITKAFKEGRILSYKPTLYPGDPGYTGLIEGGSSNGSRTDRSAGTERT